MSKTKATLARAFRLPRKKNLKPVKVAPKPGNPPHIDLASVAETFLAEHYSKQDPHYGHWVTKALWESLNAYHPRSQGVFHPSSGLHPDISNCPRLIMFDLMMCERTPQGISPTLARILDNGTNRHVGLHVLFAGMAKFNHQGIVHYEAETKLTNELLCLAGHRDGRVLTSAAWPYDVDFKGINDKGFSKTYEPSFKHRIQLNTYMGMSGAKAGYIIYENKNNQAWATPMQNMRVNFDGKHWKATEKFCADILKLLAKGDIPDFDQATCDDCITFCPYKGVCDLERQGTRLGELDRRDGETKKRHLQVV